MELKFRKLRADEIDVRLGTQKLENPQDKYSRIVGASYLLYKDARCDMAMLDEAVGPFNWQRTHEFKEGKLYCTVSLYDIDKKIWVSKEDVGVESNTEAEKGQASDSFKRACFNWGIGRELYTAPFIWISAGAGEDLRKVKMTVTLIEYSGNEISALEITDNNGVVRFSMGTGKKTKEPAPQPKPTNVQDLKLIKQLQALGGSLEKIRPLCKKEHVEDITNEEISHFIQLKESQLKKTSPKKKEEGIESIFNR